MTLCYIVSTEDFYSAALEEIMARDLAYYISEKPITYFASELTIKCDPSDAAEIERILAPIV